MNTEADEILVRKSLEGDERAFAELVARYERVIYTVALRMLGSREDAREITQATFVKAWRGLAGFDANRRFFSWIYRITIHECLNHRRHGSRFEALEVEPRSPGPGPDEQAEGHEIEACVQAALGRLAAGDREVLVLRHFLDMSYEAMSEALGIPSKTVKSRLYTARQRLRVELARIGVER
jgi:RNA polymerase sigma-70 factor (ECF subfamily)